MRLDDIGPKNVHTVNCEKCKGNPDFIYFNDESHEILSVICKGCRDAFEGAIISMGRAYADLMCMGSEEA